MTTNEALTTENAVLREQLRNAELKNTLLDQQLSNTQEQLRITQKQLSSAQELNTRMLESHHTERIKWLGSLTTIDTKMNKLLEVHKDSSARIQGQLDVLTTRLTIHPNEMKTQGFALVLRDCPDEGKHIQFIAGQRQYVMKKLKDETIAEVLFEFQSIASGVNLRNRFAKAANMKLVEALGSEVCHCVLE